MPSDPDNPLTEAHLTAIGRVIVAWATAERVIMDSLWEIATQHSLDREDASISLALVTGMESRVALGILKAVFRARHLDDADEFDKLVDALGKLRVTRNIVAHGRWLKGDRPKEITAATFKSSGALRLLVHGFTPEELERLAARITARRHWLMSFLQKRGYWKRPASRDK